MREPADARRRGAAGRAVTSPPAGGWRRRRGHPGIPSHAVPSPMQTRSRPRTGASPGPGPPTSRWRAGGVPRPAPYPAPSLVPRRAGLRRARPCCPWALRRGSGSCRACSWGTALAPQRRRSVKRPRVWAQGGRGSFCPSAQRPARSPQQRTVRRGPWLFLAGRCALLPARARPARRLVLQDLCPRWLI